MKVSFNNLYQQWTLIKDKAILDLDDLFYRSDFILGTDVEKFEKKFANFLDIPYAVGVSNGTDALKLAALALEPKGTPLVVIPANTYIATIFGIENAIPDADFLLVDCDEYYQLDTNKLENILKTYSSCYSTIIVVCVHLYGYTCDMEKIVNLCNQYNAWLIEDASQAHGAKAYGRYAGTFGHIAAFSLYPGKNLGAAGDGGIVVTPHQHLYEKLLPLRNLGAIKKYHHITKGYNHRLDSLQAIILNHKLDYLEEWNERRRQIVNRLEKEINNTNIQLPLTPNYCLPIHHIYPVLTYNKQHFQKYLTLHNIEHGMHYPIPIEKTPMYTSLPIYDSNPNTMNYCNTATSLPMHPFLTSSEIDYMINIINAYNPSITLE